MENDRELLEYAAKAAGHFVATDINNHPTEYFCELPNSSAFEWNPLTNDGDALRLAVKLGLTVEQWLNAGYVYAGFPGQAYADEKHKTDPYEATRRAIVRAAAEIGKQMNGS